MLQPFTHPIILAGMTPPCFSKASFSARKSACVKSAAGNATPWHLLIQESRNCLKLGSHVHKWLLHLSPCIRLAAAVATKMQ